MQFLAGFDDDTVAYFAFKIFQTIIFLVIEKVGNIRMQAHDDILAAVEARVLAFDRAQHVVGDGRRGLDPAASFAMRESTQQLILQTLPRALACHLDQAKLGNF